ncbi:MAG: MotA/TolQ/ExbB proton channel family protein [Phycisphaera sp.]|nr:MotA/TolQ/ExbB proton channel family protein [Phycisphaera sp.]
MHTLLQQLGIDTLLRHGGWVLAVIFALSILGWALVAWKWLALRVERRGGRHWPQRVVDLLRERQLADAIALCREHPTMVGRLLLESLTCREPQRAWFEERLAPVIDAEAEQAHRGIRLVGMLAVIAPLLGLLGTVLGMMQSFDVINVHGAKDPALLADGIGQALLTTQAGLLVALPLLLLHRVLLSNARQLENHARLYVKKVETILCHD